MLTRVAGWGSSGGTHLKHHAVDGCHSALQNEQPLPAPQAAKAVHVEDARRQWSANDLCQGITTYRKVRH